MFPLHKTPSPFRAAERSSGLERARRGVGEWMWILKSSPVRFHIALKVDIETSQIDALPDVELEARV
jgi:hypothetical protein